MLFFFIFFFLYPKFTFICWTVPSHRIAFASSSSVSQAPFCTFTAPTATAQVWSHEMITIYIAHTVSYKAEPSFMACCSGVMGFHLKHLALCLWPRRLLQHGNISGCLTAKDPAHEGLRRRFMPGVLATRCMQLKAIHLNSPPRPKAAWFKTGP